MRNMVTLFYKVKTAYIIIIRNKIEDLISWPVVQYKNDVKGKLNWCSILPQYSFYQTEDSFIPVSTGIILAKVQICNLLSRIC